MSLLKPERPPKIKGIRPAAGQRWAWSPSIPSDRNTYRDTIVHVTPEQFVIDNKEKGLIVIRDYNLGKPLQHQNGHNLEPGWEYEEFDDHAGSKGWFYHRGGNKWAPSEGISGLSSLYRRRLNPLSHHRLCVDMLYYKSSNDMMIQVHEDGFTTYLGTALPLFKTFPYLDNLFLGTRDTWKFAERDSEVAIRYLGPVEDTDLLDATRDLLGDGVTQGEVDNALDKMAENAAHQGGCGVELPEGITAADLAKAIGTMAVNGRVNDAAYREEIIKTITDTFVKSLGKPNVTVTVNPDDPNALDVVVVLPQVLDRVKINFAEGVFE